MTSSLFQVPSAHCPLSSPTSRLETASCGWPPKDWHFCLDVVPGLSARSEQNLGFKRIGLKFVELLFVWMWYLAANRGTGGFQCLNQLHNGRRILYHWAWSTSSSGRTGRPC
ncbi:hypothetical protein V5799_026012 [Amblyomma americanum]|uniref:Uncharacterized protein n=1 Tax=Amblyomma americanum TaxID=6943 RepID=A0AAQ4DJS5_AMBAM